MTAFAITIVCLTVWCLLALPLGVLIGKAISYGQRERRPGYLPDETYRGRR